MATMLHSKRFRWIVIALAVILLCGGGAFALHARSVHKAQKTSGPIPTSKKTATSKAKKSGTGGTSASSSSKPNVDKQASSPESTSTVLITPYGTFVSNHRPGQSGSPTTEQSVCNTSPGATCDIQFTDGNGVTKTLGAVVADKNGVAYWAWDVSGATLAPGSWKVTAVVKLNGQTKTASDPTPLEIQ